jgi:hypothetical protein
VTDHPENWTPAFEGQRPPFEPGNSLAVKHGATSPARVNPRAEEIAEQAISAVPYLGAEDFAPALRAWARAEASLELLAEWVDRHGLLDDEGKPQPWVSTLLRFERLAAGHRTRLGLDPASRARLERELAEAAKGRFDVKALIDEGRKTLARNGGAK